MGAEGLVRDRMRTLARRLTVARISHGAAWWLASMGGAALALFLLDNLLHLPAALRLVATLALVVVAVRELARRVVRPLRRPVGAEAAALLVEGGSGRADNLLINAVQFEGQDLGAGERAMIAPVMVAAQAEAATLPLARLCGYRAVALWTLAAGLALAAWTCYGLGYSAYASNALRRFALPLGDVPPLGDVAVDMDPVGAITLAEGSDVTIRVAVRILRAGAGHPGDPQVLWAEGRSTVDAEALAQGGAGFERLPLRRMDGGGAPGQDTVWQGVLPAVKRPFALRAFCGDGCSRALVVDVQPMPRLTTSAFLVTPPAYVGTTVATVPGPPAPVAVLPGSHLGLRLATDRPVREVAWIVGGRTVPCERQGGAWTATMPVTVAVAWRLAAVWEGGRCDLATGSITIDNDRPPAVTLTTAGENRMALPGSSMPLEITAQDDHGLRALWITARDSADGAPWTVKEWRYLGPPGLAEDRQRHTLRLDPARFQPGHAYVIEASASDWSPAGKPGVSKPLLVRVKSIDDLTAQRPGDREAVAALKEAIARQREAMGLTDNLSAQLADALANKRLVQHRDAIAKRQGDAQAAGRRAQKAYALAKDANMERALTPLVDGEMRLVNDDLTALPTVVPGKAARTVSAIRDRQGYILAKLIALLGEAVAGEQAKQGVSAPEEKVKQPPSVTEAVRQTAADLDEFIRRQERVLERSRSLMEGDHADLSSEKDRILGDLAREEAELAKFIQEKLTDFSKLPKQDFADGSLLSQFNAVFQEVGLADAKLYEKRIELAVPHEQSGLELAKTLEHNLEKWLADRPDNIQWKMEEPEAQADVPLTELPKQLEDIVGDLLDKEEAMEDDIEDMTSSWMDNLDKGAGWGTGDGPISNMSAKGVTGNVLPNKNEVGGRSGEGRSGRSSGQMVESEAFGKKGRETPTRLSPGPFEQGAVKDHSTDPTGGATGGGKVSGADQEGLRGPVPPALQQAMQRLSGQQARLRQEAGALAVQLRARRTPNGSLETAVQAMAAVEDAARRGDGGAIRQRYTEAVDALKDTRRQVTVSGLGRERIRLDQKDREGQTQGGRDRIPPGYEDMAASYFQRLAQPEGEK